MRQESLWNILGDIAVNPLNPGSILLFSRSACHQTLGIDVSVRHRYRGVE